MRAMRIFSGRGIIVIVAGCALLWAAYQLFFGCPIQQFNIGHVWKFENSARQRVAFTSVDEGKLFLYGNQFQCLHLSRWQEVSPGEWERDEDSVSKNTWLTMTDGLRVVEERRCDAGAGKFLPKYWAVSPKGTRLAWIWETQDEKGVVKRVLRVARLDERLLDEFGLVRNVDSDANPVSQPIKDLAFVDEDLVLIVDVKDTARLWDCKNDKIVKEFRVVEGTTVVNVLGDVVASANLKVGRVGGVGVGNELPEGMTVPTGIGSNEQSPTGLWGTAMKLGPDGLVVVASSEGTFGIVEVKGEETSNVVSERSLDGLQAGILSVLWLDAKNIAFGGRSRSLQVVFLDSPEGKYSIDDSRGYEIELEHAPVRVEWLFREPKGTRIAYGDSGSVFVGHLKPICKRRDVPDVLAVLSIILAVLSLVASMTGMGRGGKG